MTPDPRLAGEPRRAVERIAELEAENAGLRARIARLREACEAAERALRSRGGVQ